MKGAKHDEKPVSKLDAHSIIPMTEKNITILNGLSNGC
jgi:hypothetical protein